MVVDIAEIGPDIVGNMVAEHFGQQIIANLDQRRGGAAQFHQIALELVELAEVILVEIALE